jgi:TonB family protein
MKLNLLVLLFFFAMLSIRASAQNEEAGPQVVQAYSATYPAVAAAARASGSVIVEAEIDSSGKVTLVRTVDGIRLLGAAAEKSARRWVFAPEDAKKNRTVRLTFTFKLMPDDAPADELLPIFLPPYRIEVRQALPKVIDSPNVDPPLPLRKKP